MICIAGQRIFNAMTTPTVSRAPASIAVAVEGLPDIVGDRSARVIDFY